MYAFTTHASELWVNPRSVRIDGSATFTIVVSSTIMKLPRHRTIRARQRARCSLVTANLQTTFQLEPEHPCREEPDHPADTPAERVPKAERRAASRDHLADRQVRHAGE